MTGIKILNCDGSFTLLSMSCKMFIIHTKYSAEEEVSKRFSVTVFFHVFKQPIKEMVVSIWDVSQDSLY